MQRHAAQHRSDGADASRRRRWPRRVLCNPITTAVAGVLLLADVSAVSHLLSPDRRSILGSWIGSEILGAARPTWYPGPSVELYIVQEAEGLRGIDPEVESWDELGALLTQRDAAVAMVSYRPLTARSGFWAPTVEEERKAAHIEPLVGAERWTDEARRGALTLFAEHLRATHPRDADVVAAGGAVRRAVLWGGHAHNAAALALLAVFVLSLGWVPGAPARWRAWRRTRALSRGRCPGCGYSIAGLERMKCPECGAEWGGGEMAAAGRGRASR